jgi:hypothetical protein
MRGVYEASYKISGLNSARTLLYITAPANKVVQVIGASVTNASNATNQQLECYVKRISSLGTPTATTVTPSPTETGDAAAGSTVKANVTGSEPTYGSNTQLGYRGFPSLAGWEYAPEPEERPHIAGSDSWGLYIPSTATSFDAIVRLSFREIG